MPWATPQLPFELTEWWWLRQCEAQASRCCLRTRNCGQTRHRPATFETMSEEKTLNDNRFPKDFYISETTWNSELSNTPVQRGLAARVNGPVKDRSLNQPFHIWITPLKFASLHQQTLGIRKNQKRAFWSFRSWNYDLESRRFLFSEPCAGGHLRSGSEQLASAWLCISRAQVRWCFGKAVTALRLQ